MKKVSGMLLQKLLETTHYKMLKVGQEVTLTSTRGNTGEIRANSYRKLYIIPSFCGKQFSSEAQYWNLCIILNTSIAVLEF